MNVNKLSSINTSIVKLTAAEKITKQELSYLSRGVLDYIMLDAGQNDEGKDRELHDIDAVNRLITVLTPVNKSVAILYFRHFLPFAFNEETNTFGKMNKKQKSKKVELITDWLKDENNDIWQWSEDNIDVAKKPVALGEDITKAVQRAIAGTEETRTKEATEALSVPAILDAVVAGGVTAQDLLAMLLEGEKQAA